MLVVFPVTALDLALRPANNPGHSIFMPDRFGYYGNHAVFFAASVLVVAALLWIVGAAIDRPQPDGVSSWASKQIAVPKMKPQIKPFSAQPRPVTRFDY